MTLDNLISHVMFRMRLRTFSTALTCVPELQGILFDCLKIKTSYSDDPGVVNCKLLRWFFAYYRKYDIGVSRFGVCCKHINLRFWRQTFRYSNNWARFNVGVDKNRCSICNEIYTMYVTNLQR